MVFFLSLEISVWFLCGWFVAIKLSAVDLAAAAVDAAAAATAATAVDDVFWLLSSFQSTLSELNDLNRREEEEAASISSSAPDLKQKSCRQSGNAEDTSDCCHQVQGF